MPLLAFSILAGQLLIAPASALPVDTLHRPAWSVTGDTTHCVLQQAVPGFGMAQFAQSKGHAMDFTLHSQRDLARAAKLEIVAAPPPWRHNGGPAPLVAVTSSRGRKPLSLGMTQAGILLRSLQAGQMVLFSDRDRNYSPIAALSPLAFQPALEDFNQCVAALPALPSSAFSRLRLRFATGSAQLDARARQVLDEALLRLHDQPDITGIALSGHSDASGSVLRNEELSRQRMLVATDYLIAHGVPPQIISTSYLGSRKPIRGASAAANRRVEINFRYGVTTASK